MPRRETVNSVVETTEPIHQPEDIIRSFMAVEISDEVRAALVESQEAIKQIGARIGWVAPENIHLTLLFLSDIFAARIPELKNIVEAATQVTPAFRFEVVGLGFFGSPRSPRILWAGIAHPPDSLMTMQHQLTAAVRDMGIKTEDRPFSPHLTLGRVRDSRRAGELTSSIQSDKSKSYGWVAVERLLLMQSRLGSQGAQYSILHSSHLKGAGSHGG